MLERVVCAKRGKECAPDGEPQELIRFDVLPRPRPAERLAAFTERMRWPGRVASWRRLEFQLEMGLTHLPRGCAQVPAQGQEEPHHSATEAGHGPSGKASGGAVRGRQPVHIREYRPIPRDLSGPPSRSVARHAGDREQPAACLVSHRGGPGSGPGHDARLAAFSDHRLGESPAGSRCSTPRGACERPDGDSGR